jgi:hypothetical protein
MRHPFLAAGLIELLEAHQLGMDRLEPISAHDPVFNSALRGGAIMACLEGDTIDRIAALIESTRALNGVLALVLASTPPGELSANEMDALTDLSYKIHLDLDQLNEIWEQASDELTRGHN